MRDIGHEDTDKLISSLERKIRREYSQAEKELQAKLDDYFRRFAIKDEKWRKMVANGEKTKDEYAKWRVGQMFVGERWTDMRDTIAEDLHNANVMARSMITGQMPTAFAANVNWTTYQIEHDGRVNTGFTLYNRDSVETLLKDNPRLLAPPGAQMKQTFKEGEAYTTGKPVTLTPEKQKAFDKLIAQGKDVKWQKSKLQSVVMQSILQGESIPAMSRRIANTLGEINHKASIRYARTAMTSAQEQGRSHAYKRAEDLGVKLKREWRAVFDMRTRHAHRQLDGQIRAIDEPFEVDGEEIMFPGDPSAAGYLVYNCRCRTTAEVEGWDKESRKLRSDEAVGGMSYDDWKKGHSKPQGITQPEITGKKKKEQTIQDLYDKKKQNIPKFQSTALQNSLGSDYDEFADYVTNAPTRKMYENYIDNCGGLHQMSSRGFYRPGTDSVHYSFDQYVGINKYSTLAHESGHMFDRHIGRHPDLHYSEVDLLNSRCSIGSGMFKIFKVAPSQSDEFLTALRADMANLEGKVKSREIRTLLLIDEKTKNATSGVQDALDGFFSTFDSRILSWGHGDVYYNRSYNRKIKDFGLDKDLKQAFKDLGFDASNQTKVKRLSRTYETASEAWANICSATTVGGAELEAFEKYMPETLKAFRMIAGKVK